MKKQSSKYKSPLLSTDALELGIFLPVCICLVARIAQLAQTPEQLQFKTVIGLGN